MDNVTVTLIILYNNNIVDYHECLDVVKPRWNYFIISVNCNGWNGMIPSSQCDQREMLSLELIVYCTMSENSCGLFLGTLFSF